MLNSPVATTFNKSKGHFEAAAYLPTESSIHFLQALERVIKLLERE